MMTCTRLGLLIFALLFCSLGYAQRNPKNNGNRSVTKVNTPLNAFYHL